MRNPLSPYRFGGLTERAAARDPFLSLYRDLNGLFDEAFRPGPASSQLSGMITPQMDVSETDKEVRLRAELPGVSEKDIDVSVNDDILTIRAEKKSEREEEKEDYHFMERSFGTFQRTLRLPYSVDADKVKASLENGVLTVSLPKGKDQERVRHIPVQGGNGQGRLGGAKDS